MQQNMIRSLKLKIQAYDKENKVETVQNQISEVRMQIERLQAKNSLIERVN